MSQKLFRKNVTFWSSLGASLEYYDFIIFTYLAPTLSMVFFDDSSHASLIKTYMISSIAYFARPLGSLLYGLIGDVRGRYKTFLGIMYTMAFSTLAIGFLPSFKTIGITASILLFFCRVFQGISFGAELPGAMIVVCEHKKDTEKGRVCGFVISSITLGSILACFFSFGLTWIYPQETIIEWAWRIPFLFGGILGLINLWIRKNLSETPVFLSLQKQKKHETLWKPLQEILKSYKMKIALGVFFGLSVACLIVSYAYFPRLFPAFYGYAPKDVYWYSTLGLLWSAILVPLLGSLSDRLGYALVFRCSSILTLGSIVFLFMLPERGSVFLLLFFLGFQTLIVGLISAYFPILVSLFPPHIRFTGVALCYNVTYAFISLLPALLTAFFEYPPTLLIGTIIGLSFISLIAFEMMGFSTQRVEK